MLTVYSELHKLQHGRNELMPGKLVPVFEMPKRAEIIINRVREVKLGDVIEPRDLVSSPSSASTSRTMSAFYKPPGTSGASWAAPTTRSRMPGRCDI